MWPKNIQHLITNCLCLFILACSKLSFGLECERECSCKDGTEQCDPQTGFCSSGCRPGRIGIGCQIGEFTGLPGELYKTLQLIQDGTK